MGCNTNDYAKYEGLFLILLVLMLKYINRGYVHIINIMGNNILNIVSIQEYLTLF